MSAVIICQGFADNRACDTMGQYLERFDPNWGDGLGRAWWTPYVGDAMKFPDGAVALSLWRASSTVRPRRLDGAPNRPLTAYTVEIRNL